MSNDLIPGSSSSPLQQFIEKLNLPELIAGPAGRAISRLIAGVVEFPASHLEGFAQSVKDKTSARSLVNNAVAEAAARLVASDPGVVQRAAHNLLAKEYRHQENKEAIAFRAIELLSDPAHQSDPISSTPPDVDDDWLNVFERYAEDASSGRLRELWARVLVGEIRKPKSFSLPTLRFIAELEADVAALFERYAPMIVSGDIIPYPISSQGDYTEMLSLEHAGLISFSGGTLSSSMEAKRGTTIVPYKTHALVIEAKEDVILRLVQNAPLTKISKEIYSILSPGDSIEFARMFADRISKNGLERISYARIVRSAPDVLCSPVEELWRSTDPNTGTSS